MASIRRYKTAKGSAWRVQYRSPDGKSRTKQGFRTKDAATAWAERNATLARDGQWVAPEVQRRTVTDLYPIFRASQEAHLKPSTLRVNRIAWETYVEPMWGGRLVGSIRPSEVQAWADGIRMSRTTVSRAVGVLKGVLDVAVADGVMRVNPAAGVTMPRKGAPRHVFLTAVQVRMLAEESAYPTVVWVLATTGLRWGELAALRVEDVDLVRRRLSITKSVTYVAGEGMVVSSPKTHEVRSVAVSRFVAARLAGEVEGKTRRALVFPARGGGYMRVPDHRSWFAGAVGRCQSRDDGFPRVTVHGLRHVAAGLLVQSGASVKVVQRQLGHKSAAMTLDQYADLFDGDLDVVGEVMDSVFGCRGNVVGLG